MKCRLLNRLGFSSIESVLTVGVLGFGLLGGMMVMQGATLNTVNGDLHSIGTQLANEKVESLMADAHYKGYDFITSALGTEDLSSDHPGFSRQVSVKEVNANDLTTIQANSGMKRIDVTVMWGSEAYQHVTMTTLVHKE